MRHPPPSSRINSWRGHKEQGKIHFQNHEYDDALASYRAALSPEYGCPMAERQVLLSNVVACRLHIGGPAMARAAIEDAKQCVALNETWAKGHVRLASAYIALGDHSNDACNALQRALSLDPGNTTARQMLLRELRRDSQPPQPQEEQQQQQQPQPSAPPEEFDVPRPDQNHDDEVEDSLSWSDRLKFHYARGVIWYHGQSEDIQTFMKVVLTIVVLYVAFGGRFGLDRLFHRTPQNRGNYEAGNAYDRYRSRYAPTNMGSYKQGQEEVYMQQKRRQQQQTSHDYDYDYQPTRSRQTRKSFHFPNLFDGSMLSMICLAAFGYACHRFGVNPFHALWMMNMVAGNRGRGMHRMPMYGMGYGMMRNAFGNNRQQPNRWYG